MHANRLSLTRRRPIRTRMPDPQPDTHDNPPAPPDDSQQSTANHADGSGALTDPVLDLLVEWDAQRRRGLDPSPEQLCAGRPELLPEFRARLSRLRRFGAAATEPGPAADAAPPTIPGYQLLGSLGEGGMGVV